MRKYILSGVALLLTSVSMAQPEGEMVVIRGALAGDLKGFDKIYWINGTHNDSAEIVEGQYTFSFPFSKPAMHLLIPEYIKTSRQPYQPFGILVARPGIYYVVSDIGEGMQQSHVNGPEEMRQYRHFEKAQQEANRKVNALLTARYGERWWQLSDQDARYAAIQLLSDSLQRRLVDPLIGLLVRKYPDSYASAFVLATSGRHLKSIEEMEDLFSLLTDSLKNTAEGQAFSRHIQGLKSSAVGTVVKHFTLPDPQGKELDWAALRGKYVLIDFWASWCIPCRQSFTHMRSVYQKYKGDQFEIFSISTDKDREAWLKAVQQEALPWPQAHDIKNVAQKGFAVTGLPTTFLINKEGKIMLKEVGFNADGTGAIEKKLQELFGAGEK